MEMLADPTTLVSYHIYHVKSLLTHIIDLASDKNNIISLSVSPQHFNDPNSPPQTLQKSSLIAGGKHGGRSELVALSAALSVEGSCLSLAHLLVSV